MNIPMVFETIFLMAAGVLIGIIATALLRALAKNDDKQAINDGKGAHGL